MALIVKVFVNDRQIIDTHAVRIKGKGKGELCTYRNEDGTILHHYYDDGSEDLAIQLLKIHRDKQRATSKEA